MYLRRSQTAKISLKRVHLPKMGERIVKCYIEESCYLHGRHSRLKGLPCLRSWKSVWEWYNLVIGNQRSWKEKKNCRLPGFSLERNVAHKQWGFQAYTVCGHEIQFHTTHVMWASPSQEINTRMSRINKSIGTLP